MNELNINLLTPETPPKKRVWHYLILGAGVFLIIVLAVFASSLLFSQDSSSLTENQKPGFFTQLKNLILSSDRQLKGEAEDRINILLLGIGGQGHDGAYLTDTIILASLKPSSHQVALLSVPRDLIVLIPGYGYRKINNADAFGELQQKGSGSQLAAKVVEETFGLLIHYYVRVDFEGFKKMIDEVGGIKVYADRAFTDEKFPTFNYKYRTVSFEQGWQKMDGQTALDFARSRHGNNGEAGDFARARRQQKVIVAFKDKIFSFSTLLNPNRWQNLSTELSSHVQTNLEWWELNLFYKIAKKLDYENLISRVLTAGENGPLVESQFEGASILQPRAGNFEEIQRLAREIFSNQLFAWGAPTVVEKQKTQPANQPKILIQNGTWILGLAAQTKAELEEKGLSIAEVGNALKRNQEKTFIYDFSAGKFPEALNKLKEELKADIIANPPEELIDPAAVTPDILVILGKDRVTN